ncbi:MAG: OstA-like protein [Bacteroidota bacterium]|nr:OstA-like protein [Bacteroidota bacterium]MDP4216862.1 OstA-like protein [Bacteroidota bacterium]
MKSRNLAYAACLLFFLVTGARALAQGSMEFRSSGNDSVKTVFILHDTVYRFVQKDSVTDMVFILGNVILREDKTLIYCDSMVRSSRDNFIEAFGHVRIFDGDSTNIYSDYMKYQAISKTVLFQKNVRLTDGKGVLTTQELQYDLNSKIGVYTHGGKVVNNGSVLTSDEATYFEDSKDVLFRKNVVLRDPQYDLSSDSLRYNTQTQISTFITETFIQFKDSTQRTVRTREGYYDLRHKKAQFGRRPVITDGSQRITGDSVSIDDSTGISVAKGNADYVDTAQGVRIRAGYMINNQKKTTFLAVDKPLMILKQDKDSIYITADTLFSGRLVDAEAVARAVARQDSLHRRYIDSIDRRAADSLHRAVADSLHRRGLDTVQVVASDSAHRIIVKDESHAPRGDSATQAAGRDSARAVTKVIGGKDSARALAPPLRGAPARRRTNIYNDDGRIASGRAAAAPDTALERPTDSTMRYIKGYHHVRIFSDSLQAVADSLYYSGKDSVFRLYKDPVAWGSGDYQITGDTMFVFTKNKKADRLYVFENALAINKVGPNFYNQIKGNTINGYFKDGQMDFMRAKGNAESIYYVRDDNKAYTGVNKAHADIIDMIFKEKELDRVVFRSDAEGTMIPFKKVNFDEMRLRGFRWQDERRPKSKEELMR